MEAGQPLPTIGGSRYAAWATAHIRYTSQLRSNKTSTEAQLFLTIGDQGAGKQIEGDKNTTGHLPIDGSYSARNID